MLVLNRRAGQGFIVGPVRLRVKSVCNDYVLFDVAGRDTLRIDAGYGVDFDAPVKFTLVVVRIRANYAQVGVKADRSVCIDRTRD